MKRMRNQRTKHRAAEKFSRFFKIAQGMIFSHRQSLKTRELPLRVQRRFFTSNARKHLLTINRIFPFESQSEPRHAQFAFGVQKKLFY